MEYREKTIETTVRFGSVRNPEHRRYVAHDSKNGKTIVWYTFDIPERIGDMKVGTIALGNASAHIGYPQIVPANQRGFAREITELFVPEEHRGKGEASALLQAITEQADQDALLLIIQADTPKLETFYAKHGFTTIQRDGAIIMARAPEGVTRH